MCKMTPIGVRLNLKNFILISCTVMELLKKVSRGAESALPPPKVRKGQRNLNHEIGIGTFINK